MSDTYELTVTRTIPASREAVFNAWLQPEALARFMCPVDGATCAKVDVDARVGGAYTIVMMAGEQQMPNRGEYTVIDKYSRLAFTWRSPHAGDNSVVTLTFEDLDGDKTALTLRHSGLPSKPARDNHEGGWGTIVDLLIRVVS